MRMNIFNKILLIIAFLTSVSFKVSSETVSQKEASRLAEIFFNAANGQVMAKPKLVYNAKKLTTDRLFSPFYVYNHPTGGFVIISAENKAMPILAYSLKSNFDPDDLEPFMLELLKDYAHEIEMVRYNSEIPEKAVWSWTNFNEYLAALLNAKYDATDPVFSSEDIEEMMAAFPPYGAEPIYSDIYSSFQWDDIVTDELVSKSSVAIAVGEGERIFPAVVHGKKGDYFRIRGERLNDWLMLLSATETIGADQVIISAFADSVIDNEDHETPFAGYENFINETEKERIARFASLEEKINPTSPNVRNIGGGRYEILNPGGIKETYVFNLGGSRVRSQTFKDAEIASINLEGLPYGFYMVQIIGSNGEIHGFKLAR